MHEDQVLECVVDWSRDGEEHANHVLHQLRTGLDTIHANIKALEERARLQYTAIRSVRIVIHEEGWQETPAPAPQAAPMPVAHPTPTPGA